MNDTAATTPPSVTAPSGDGAGEGAAAHPQELLAKPRGCTNLKLRQLTRAVSAHYDHVLESCGLTGAQYSLLSHVIKLGPLRPVQLARVMTMSPSTLSRSLRPLVEAGWLEHCAGPNGRGHCVQATEAGRVMRAHAREGWLQAQLTLNARLGNERVVALHAMIDTCIDLLSSGGGVG